MHNWDDYRFFGAVAETGSFSQAAKLLLVNHSTVSRRIQAMEEQHGVRLFERTQTGYQLTDAGASIYDIVLNLQHDTHKAARVLQGQDERLEGTINLTMPNDMFMFMMAKPLLKFSHQHPDIDFNLLVSKGLRNMANREADLAIRVTATPPEYLIGTLITKLQHGFYQQRYLQYDDATPLIVWSGETSIPAWAKEHFENPKIVLRVDDLYSMHQAVKAGFGIARMPCFMPDIVKDDNVIRLQIDAPRSDFGVWVLHHEDLRNSAKINACRRFVKQVLVENKSIFEGKHSNYAN